MQAIIGRVSSSLLVTEKKLCERFAFTIKKKRKARNHVYIFFLVRCV